MTRRLAALVLLLLAAGCTSLDPIRFPTRDEELRAAADELAGFARETWHLPLDVRVFLSNGEHGRALPDAQLARERRLVAAQLAAVRQAYALSPFDLYAVWVSVSGDGRPRAELRGDDLRLEVRLPVPTDDGEPAVVDAGALLEAWGEGYRYRRAARWYEGERVGELRAALARDLGKLRDLRAELERATSRLSLLAATASARAATSGADVTFTPSECGYAREAQARSLLALHRTLNTLARWRLAAQDPTFSLRDEALLAAYGARLLHEGALNALLDVLVGERPVLEVWDAAWWHRNPLYKLLDAEAPLVPLGPGQAPGRIPAGSVRALLGLRLEDDLDDCCDELDELWAERGEELEETASDDAAALAREVALSRDELPRLETLRAGGAVGGFAAWKELWDARLKNGFNFPFYQLVRTVSSFLGDTRLRHPEPAVSEEQLRALAGRLRAGDVILVRQDLYLSNAFLPGFWPHAILYLGPEEEWTALPLTTEVDGDVRTLGDDPLVQRVLPTFRAPADGGPARVIEAISEGVVFNSLEHAVQKDYVVVFRPEVSDAERGAAIRRALTLFGRPYDFSFDFATDDKIVCTEVIYRAYNPLLNFRVREDAVNATAAAVPGLLSIMGRLTLPANELARYAIHMQDHPEPAPALGYPGRRLRLLALYDREGGRTTLFEGEQALARLRETLSR